jgi:hypothetical protein
MASLSFARIMYGTSDDFHAAQGAGAPAVSSLKGELSVANMAKEDATSEPDALGELLHRAWTILKSKS